MRTKKLTIFRGDTGDKYGVGERWDVRGEIRWGVLYDAVFEKKTAQRIAELGNSANPPVDWESTMDVLLCEGYDISISD